MSGQGMNDFCTDSELRFHAVKHLYELAPNAGCHLLHLRHEHFQTVSPQQMGERALLRCIGRKIMPSGYIEQPQMALDRPHHPIGPLKKLELTGRDIHISNGCYNCHSEQVRPLRFETDRYGEYSKIGEFVYDHPFQWGSRRTGPDLARTGWVGSSTYKTAIWHYNHCTKPKEINPQTIMPAYPWFTKNSVDLAIIPAKIRAMQTLGVPYEKDYDKKSVADYQEQAQKIVAELKASGVDVAADKEIVAMIAYLHKLGRDISPANQK